MAHRCKECRDMCGDKTPPYCRQCKFWLDILARRKDRQFYSGPYPLVVGDTHYIDMGDKLFPKKISAEVMERILRTFGSGGRRYWILFNDGRRRTTNNLWVNGTIPERFQERLPSEAAFVWPDRPENATKLTELHRKAGAVWASKTSEVLFAEDAKSSGK